MEYTDIIAEIVENPDKREEILDRMDEFTRKAYLKWEWKVRNYKKKQGETINLGIKK